MLGGDNICTVYGRRCNILTKTKSTFKLPLECEAVGIRLLTNPEEIAEYDKPDSVFGYVCDDED